jgi:hypothetical protein
MAVPNKQKLKEITREESFPLLVNPKTARKESPNQTFKESFLSSNSPKAYGISTKFDASISSFNVLSQRKEMAGIRQKGKGSLSVTLSPTNFKISNSKQHGESVGEERHLESFFDHSMMSKPQKKKELSASESTSFFYNSFEPVYSKKMAMLNEYHKKTMSQLGLKEYYYLKDLARQKLSTLLQDQLDLPTKEVDKLMQAKNPFSATFEFQMKNKQEFFNNNPSKFEVCFILEELYGYLECRVFYQRGNQNGFDLRENEVCILFGQSQK